MALPKAFKVVGALVAVGALAAVAIIGIKEKIKEKEEIEEREAEQEAFNKELNRLQNVVDMARILQYDDDDDGIIYYA